MPPNYVIVDQRDPLAPTLCSPDSPIYTDRHVVERDARRLRRMGHTPDIRAYELISPGTLYIISEEDVFQVARDRRMSKKKVSERMDRIRKGIEGGFHDWYDVVETAIDLAMDDR